MEVCPLLDRITDVTHASGRACKIGAGGGVCENIHMRYEHRGVEVSAYFAHLPTEKLVAFHSISYESRDRMPVSNLADILSALNIALVTKYGFEYPSCAYVSHRDPFFFPIVVALVRNSYVGARDIDLVRLKQIYDAHITRLFAYPQAIGMDKPDTAQEMAILRQCLDYPMLYAEREWLAKYQYLSGGEPVFNSYDVWNTSTVQIAPERRKECAVSSHHAARMCHDCIACSPSFWCFSADDFTHLRDTYLEMDREFSGAFHVIRRDVPLSDDDKRRVPGKLGVQWALDRTFVHEGMTSPVMSVFPPNTIVSFHTHPKISCLIQHIHCNWPSPADRDIVLRLPYVECHFVIAPEGVYIMIPPRDKIASRAERSEKLRDVRDNEETAQEVTLSTLDNVGERLRKMLLSCTGPQAEAARTGHMEHVNTLTQTGIVMDFVAWEHMRKGDFVFLHAFQRRS